MANILKVPFDSKDSWSISQVTVYEDRAQVTRVLDYKTTDAGEVDLRLENLPLKVHGDSVRAVIESNNASIVEVTNNVYTSPYQSRKILPRETEIQTELLENNKQKAKLENRKKWFEDYSNKLTPTKNKSHNSNELFETLSNDNNLANFETSLDTFVKEMLVIEESLQEIKLKNHQLQKELAKVQAESQSKVEASVQTKQVSVVVNVPGEVADTGGIVTVRLSYIVSSCSWRSSYDARVEKNDKSMEISYYGKITNNSGEPWTEVQVALSTAKPSRAGVLPSLSRAEVVFKNKPEIQVLVNDVKKPKKKKKGGFGAGLRAMKTSALGSAPRLEATSMMDEDEDIDDALEMEMEAEELEQIRQEAEVDDTETENKGGSATFKLNRLCSVENDGKPHKHTIGRFKLAPTFSYDVTPRASLKCYLRCTTKNTSKYVLTAGPMAIFFNGSYVTTNEVKLVNRNENFKVYLGVEDSVSVEYLPEVAKEEKTKKGFLSSKINVKTVTRKIKVKNTRDEEITCNLVEQVPLSRVEKIKVEILSPDMNNKAFKLNKLNHLLATRSIGARKTWTLEFTYRMEWPENDEIVFTESHENTA